jgi:hypothetical protein
MHSLQLSRWSTFRPGITADCYWRLPELVTLILLLMFSPKSRPIGSADQALFVRIIQVAALQIIEQQPERVARLQENTRYFAAKLREAGFSILNTETLIFPIICGNNWQSWKLVGIPAKASTDSD